MRNIKNTGITLIWSVASIIFYFLYSKNASSFGGLVGTNESASPTAPPGLFLFLTLPLLIMLLQSANRFFGKETFIFDRNEEVFIRNGFIVGPLWDIPGVTAQVTGAGQYPMFRLILVV